MKHAKIKVSIDVTNILHVQALNSFLSVIGGTTSMLPKTQVLSDEDKPIVEKETKEEEVKEEPKTRKRRTKEQIEADKASEAIPTEVKEESKVEPEKKTVSTEDKEEAKKDLKEETTSDIKIEDVRPLLAKKVGDHRQEIKAKLTELGAPNLTSLDKAHYTHFVEFLNFLS